jgi:hypothetical protein
VYPLVISPFEKNENSTAAGDIQYRLHTIVRLLLLYEMAGILDYSVRYAVHTTYLLLELYIAASSHRVFGGKGRHKWLVELGQQGPGGLILLHLRLIVEERYQRGKAARSSTGNQECLTYRETATRVAQP